jgi:ElaB/YqjD/DUF883 family membrane-anchored ribosome-binding protein
MTVPGGTPLMSETRYSSSDIPSFDTYPSSSPRSVDFDSVPRSSLEIRAARLGSALGQFVLLLRNQKEIAVQKLSVVTEDAAAALNQTADTVKVKAEEAGEVASYKAQEVWTEAERRAQQVGDRALQNLKRAQVRAQEFQRDKPEQVAIGAGALGLALGIGLRIWRANRA